MTAHGEQARGERVVAAELHAGRRRVRGSPSARRPDLAEIARHADGETFQFDGATYVREGNEATRVWGLEFFDATTDANAQKP